MVETAKAVAMPFNEAVDFFRQKLNVPSKHWTTLMDAAHSRSFAVAGAASDALVADFRAAVDKAIAKGTSLSEFRKDFDAIVQKHGWGHTGKAEWRTRIIYQTNLSTAFSAGRWAQQTDPAVLSAFPYLEYLHVNCPNPRLQHVAWSGLVLRADDPWWDAHYPPNGWGCHCITASVNDRMLARRGRSGPDTAPDTEWREYVNRTTGVVSKHPAGVDPGFAYNPGKAWLSDKPQPVKAQRLKPVGTVPPVLALPGKSAVAPAVLDKFLSKPEGEVQVGTMPAHIAKLLPGDASHNRLVILSASTLAKQGASHPDIDTQIYYELQALISAPAAVLSNRPLHLRLFGLVQGKAVTAVVKKTGATHQWYVQSLHTASEKSIKQIAAKSNVLAGDLGVVLDGLKKRVR